jgi:hypothetical protein
MNHQRRRTWLSRSTKPAVDGNTTPELPPEVGA